MKQLHMVGYTHKDLKGPERLDKLLRSVRPDYIGVESTVEGFYTKVSNHEKMGILRTILLPQLIEDFGAKGAENIISYQGMIGYESWVSANYSNENKGVTIVACDIHRAKDLHNHALKVLEANDDDVKSEQKVTNVANMDMEDFQKKLDENYIDISVLDIQKDPALFKELCLDRDENAESIIRDSFSATKQSMVYIGGGLHIFGEYHNLYDRLKDLNPTRMKLIDVDKWEMGK